MRFIKLLRFTFLILYVKITLDLNWILYNYRGEKMSEKIKQEAKTPLFFPIVYWLILVAWQNIFPDLIGTTVDICLKMVLLAGLVFYFLHNERFSVNAPSSLLFLFFIISMMISFLINFTLSVRTLINYFFPIIMFVCIIFIGADMKMQFKQFKRILNVVILAVWFMAIYSLIFKFDCFATAFSVSSAYGNELSSFFSSNHEYALYLTIAISGCLFLLTTDKKINNATKTYYIISIIVFAVNLILTYSRSFILSTAVFVLLFVFLSRNKKLIITFCILAIIGVLTVISVPVLKDYVTDIVFKKNTLASRDIIIKETMKSFKNENILHKFFGANTERFISLLEDQTDHGSTHNAFLQIMLLYGISNLVFFIGYIIYQIVYVASHIKKDVTVISFCVALSVTSIVPMLVNTTMLFDSLNDSFFLTVFCVMVPRFIVSSVKNGEFYDVDKEEPLPEKA